MFGHGKKNLDMGEKWTWEGNRKREREWVWTWNKIWPWVKEVDMGEMGKVGHGKESRKCSIGSLPDWTTKNPSPNLRFNH